MSSDELFQRCEDSYRRFVLLRLSAAADVIQSRCTHEPMRTLFQNAWHAFASHLRGSGLLAAAGNPDLEAWVASVEAVEAKGLHHTHPETYVGSAAARFTSLLMNLASCAVSEMRGRAIVSGGPAPALMSHMQIHRRRAQRRLIDWTYQNNVLVLRDASTAAVILSVASPAEASGDDTSPDAWWIENSVGLHRARLFAAAPCACGLGELHAGFTAAAFRDACVQAYAELPEPYWALCDTFIGVIRPACAFHPSSAASAITFDGPASPEMWQAALIDRVLKRCRSLYRFSLNADLCADLGVDHLEALRTRIIAAWGALTGGGWPAELVEIVHASVEERRLASRARVSSPAPSNATTSDVLLRVSDVLTEAGVAVDGRVSYDEVKHRRRDELVDWTLLEGLLTLSEPAIDRLAQALTTTSDRELRQYGLACIAYYRADFSLAAGHLVECLALDPECENYWLLLALCCRYLGRRDSFDAIAYEGSRSTTLIASVAGVAQCCR